MKMAGVIFSIIFSFIVWGLFSGPDGQLVNRILDPIAWAQGEPDDPDNQPPAEDEARIDEMTIKLTGGGCEINLNESELLRVPGIVSVDIEAKPGKIVVGYDRTLTNKGLIKAAVGKKKGGCAANEEAEVQ